MIRAIVLLLTLMEVTVQGFISSSICRRYQRNEIQLGSSVVSRSEFWTQAQRTTAATAAMLLLFPSIPEAHAAEDLTKKGTKDDPVYQTCLSKCMYECTKPKGEETRLRKDCLPECKQKCATTKQQLMIGTPTTTAAAVK